MRLAAKVGLGALAMLAVAQVIHFEQSNPPVTADLQAPPRVKDVLRRACYDCHSNETRWPWYSRVAPVSWLLHRDVTEGRNALNFSEWGTLSPSEQVETKHDIVDSVRAGEMPLWYYLPLHPAARLSADDEGVIEAWVGRPGSDP
jgi:hypothetical protein